MTTEEPQQPTVEEHVVISLPRAALNFSQPYTLSSGNLIAAACHLARLALAAGEHEYRRAAEHIFQAANQGATQRQIAAIIGKPVSTVNGLLAWRRSDFKDPTPFGAISKAKRERARVRPVEQPECQFTVSDRDHLRAGAACTELAVETAKNPAKITTQETIKTKAHTSTLAIGAALTHPIETSNPSDTQTADPAPAVAPAMTPLSAAPMAGNYHLPQELNRQDPERAFQLLAEHWSLNTGVLFMNSPQAAQIHFLLKVVLPEVGGLEALTRCLPATGTLDNDKGGN